MTATSREAAGRLAGILGLCGNLLLFAAKCVIGRRSGSVAVTADAFNNLTDCASAVLTILGFCLAARRRDRLHPYGHGRMEYVCGFLISLLVLFAGAAVGKDAVLRLLHPVQTRSTPLQEGILAAGVAVKLLMAAGVWALNRPWHSAALKAVLIDDLADALVTAAAVLALRAPQQSAVPPDGLVGVLIALSILWTGFQSFGENLALLLGEGADAETEQAIREIILQYPQFERVECIALHDYGPAERPGFIKVTFRRPLCPEAAAKTLAAVKRRLDAELRIDATLYWDAFDPLGPAALPQGEEH